MRKLIFQPEIYKEIVSNKDRLESGLDKIEKKTLVCTNEYKCGLVELIWIMLDRLSEIKMDKKEHRITKRLRRSLKEISRFRDNDEDSRILRDGGPHTVILEEDSYDILLKHIESSTTKVNARHSDLVTELWDLIDAVKEFTPESTEETKPPLVLEK